MQGIKIWKPDEWCEWAERGRGSKHWRSKTLEGAHAGQQRTRLFPKSGLAFARSIYEVIDGRGVSLFGAKAGHTGPSGNVAPPYSDGWGLAVPKGQPCDSGWGGSGSHGINQLGDSG